MAVWIKREKATSMLASLNGRRRSPGLSSSLTNLFSHKLLLDLLSSTAETFFKERRIESQGTLHLPIVTKEMDVSSVTLTFRSCAVSCAQLAVNLDRFRNANDPVVGRSSDERSIEQLALHVEVGNTNIYHCIVVTEPCKSFAGLRRLRGWQRLSPWAMELLMHALA